MRIDCPSCDGTGNSSDEVHAPCGGLGCDDCACEECEGFGEIDIPAAHATF